MQQKVYREQAVHLLLQVFEGNNATRCNIDSQDKGFTLKVYRLGSATGTMTKKVFATKFLMHDSKEPLLLLIPAQK